MKDLLEVINYAQTKAILADPRFVSIKKRMINAVFAGDMDEYTKAVTEFEATFGKEPEKA